jgi:hypothetical protein
MMDAGKAVLLLVGKGGGDDKYADKDDKVSKKGGVSAARDILSILGGDADKAEELDKALRAHYEFCKE